MLRVKQNSTDYKKNHIGSVELKSLTGLRGVAAIYVVLYHITFLDYFNKNRIMSNFICHGYMAVGLFFILSGFVMAMTHGTDFSSGFDKRKYGIFLLRRLGRIYPLYFTATTICAIIGFWHLTYQTPQTWSHLFTNYALVQTWGFSESIDPPGWSISTEFFAYLLFPSLVTIFIAREAWLAISGTTIAIVFLVFVASRSGADFNETGIRPGPLAVWVGTTVYPLLTCIATFSIGLTVWRAWQTPFINRIASNRWVGLLISAISLILLSSLISDVLTTVAIALLILTLATEKSFPAQLLASRPIRFLGNISYSIYLVHWPVMDALQEPLREIVDRGRTGLLAPSTIIITILVFLTATLTFRIIERPARTFFRNRLVHNSPALVTL